MNTQDALCTLFDAAGFADAMMARAFADTPDALFVEQLCGEGLQDAVGLVSDDEALAEKLQAVVTLARQYDPEKAKSEFENAFFGIGSKIHPYESVFASEENALFQQQTLEVRAAYRSQGFVAPQRNQFPDDGLALELEFLQKTFASASKTLECGDEVTCRSSIDAAQAFLRDHLGVWVTDFASSFEETRYEGGLYHALALLTAELVAQEQTMIQQIGADFDGLFSE